MKIIKTKIPGLVVIEPRVFKDDRGYFFESFHSEKYSEAGIQKPFVQDNESKSVRGVVRGLHYQLAPWSQSKLVRVVQGSVYDVAVDLRKNSPTFGEWFGLELSSDNKKQLFVNITSLARNDIEDLSFANFILRVRTTLFRIKALIDELELSESTHNLELKEPVVLYHDGDNQQARAKKV